MCLPPCPPDVPFRSMPDMTEGVSEQMSTEDLAVVQRNAVSFYTDAERDFSDMVDGAANLHRVASEFAMDIDQWAYLGIEVMLHKYSSLVCFLYILFFSSSFSPMSTGACGERDVINCSNASITTLGR